jgi:hypothetical protein
MIREPFRTGARVANKAIDLPCGNDKEKEFRERQFDIAFHKLETAQTYAESFKARMNDRFTILFLKGLCGYHYDGGKPYALQLLSECNEEIERCIYTISSAYSKYRLRVSDLECQLGREDLVETDDPGGAIGNIAMTIINTVEFGMERGLHKVLHPRYSSKVDQNSRDLKSAVNMKEVISNLISNLK